MLERKENINEEMSVDHDKRFILLVTNVVSDGIGDFSHLLDIAKALSGKKKYKLAAICLVGNERYDQVAEQFVELSKLMTEESYLCETSEYFLSAIEIINGKVDLTLGVSYIRPELRSSLKNFQMLSEHEGRQGIPMGLNDETLGIKIEDKNRLSLKDLLEIIKENDVQFYNDLLRSCTQKDSSEGLEEFISKNEVIPAYFSHYNGAINFLNFLITNPSISNGKNSCIYLSGLPEDKLGAIKKHFPMIQFVKKNQEVKVEDSSKSDEYKENIKPTIRVFYGYKVSNTSYDAIYQQAPYAGVSGDNSFEKAISSKCFPFYISTNHERGKYKSLSGLNNIISLLNISDKAKEGYNQYLSYFIHEDPGIYQVPEIPPEVLNEMTAIWPDITKYLLKNNNVYNKLDDFITLCLDYRPLLHNFLYKNEIDQIIKFIKDKLLNNNYDDLGFICTMSRSAEEDKFYEEIEISGKTIEKSIYALLGYILECEMGIEESLILKHINELLNHILDNKKDQRDKILHEHFHSLLLKDNFINMDMIDVSINLLHKIINNNFFLHYLMKMGKDSILLNIRDIIHRKPTWECILFLSSKNKLNDEVLKKIIKYASDLDSLIYESKNLIKLFYEQDSLTDEVLDKVFLLRHGCSKKFINALTLYGCHQLSESKEDDFNEEIIKSILALSPADFNTFMDVTRLLDKNNLLNQSHLSDLLKNIHSVENIKFAMRLLDENKILNKSNLFYLLKNIHSIEDIKHVMDRLAPLNQTSFSDLLTNIHFIKHITEITVRCWSYKKHIDSTGITQYELKAIINTCQDIELSNDDFYLKLSEEAAKLQEEEDKSPHQSRTTYPMNLSSKDDSNSFYNNQTKQAAKTSHSLSKISFLSPKQQSVSDSVEENTNEEPCCCALM